MICSRLHTLSFLMVCVLPCHSFFSRIRMISLFGSCGNVILHSSSLSLLSSSILSAFAIPRIAVFRLFIHFCLFICFSSNSQIGFVESRSSCAALSLSFAVSPATFVLFILKSHSATECSQCLCHSGFRPKISVLYRREFAIVLSVSAFHLTTWSIGLCILSHSCLLRRVRFNLYSNLGRSILLLIYLAWSIDISLVFIKCASSTASRFNLDFRLFLQPLTAIHTPRYLVRSQSFFGMTLSLPLLKIRQELFFFPFLLKTINSVFLVFSSIELASKNSSTISIISCIFSCDSAT